MASCQWQARRGIGHERSPSHTHTHTHTHLMMIFEDEDTDGTGNPRKWVQSRCQ